MSRPGALYLCYFPLEAPLVQTQVLPYLRAIAASGVTVSLLTFEQATSTPAGQGRDDVERELAAQGIEWHRRRYHKRPSVPATLFDIAAGALTVRRHVRMRGVVLLHCRGHIPAVMAQLGRRRSGAKLLFDVRGFMPEEYVEAGLWPSHGLLFRVMKRIERWLLERSDGFVVLSERARDILTGDGGTPAVRRRPLEVIPCCVELVRIPPPTPAAKEAAKERLGVGGRRVVLYVGSTTGYYLFEEQVRFVAAMRSVEPSTFFLVLTQRDVESVTARILAAGLDHGDFTVRSVAPQEVAAHAAAADVAMCFIRVSYASHACSPTKIAEYLACGIPVVSSAGIGDLDRQLSEDGVGLLVDTPAADGYAKAVDQLESLLSEPDLAERCRRSAARRFDLETVGGPLYVRLYQRLLAGDPAAST